MIQLPLRSHGDLLVGDDAVTGRVQVVGAPPRIALDTDGRPRLRLLRWPPTTDSGAGHLSMDVSTTPTTSQREGLPGDVEFVRWEDAAVTLLGAGLEVTGAAVLGGAPFGAMSSLLDLPAAAALERHLTGDGPGLLQAVWEGHIRARMPELEVVAAIDRSEITRRTAEIRGPRRHEMIRSIIRATVHVEVQGAGGEALIEALSDWAAEALTHRLDTGGDLQIRLSAADVISPPVRLASTMEPVLESAREWVIHHLTAVPGTTAEAHTRVVVLADWAKTDHVSLEVDPEGSGTGDTTVLTVLDEAPRQLDLAGRPFRWRLRSTVAGVQQEWTPWTSSGPTLALTVPVAPPSERHVEVVAAGLDWSDRWQQVDVFLAPDGNRDSHTDDRAGRGTEVSPDAVLTGDRRRASLPVDVDPGGLVASALFWSQSGVSVPGQPIALISDQFVIRDPLRDVIEHTLVPVGGGWADVVLSMVDLRHIDGDRLTIEAVPLDPGMSLATWQVPAALGHRGQVSWRLHASLTDGTLVETDWADAADSVIPVEIPGGAFVDLHVVIAGLAVASAQRVTVTLTMGSTERTVTATEPGVHTIRMPSGTVTFARVIRATFRYADTGPDQPEKVVI
ncbi:MAG: hypothetical protein ACTHWA_09180 [Arachnia sp.]